MSTRLRLFILLGCIVTAFGGSLWFLQRSHREEAARMLAAVEEERRVLLDRMLELTGLPLANFANDYSYWDELLAFVGRPDPEWARINLALLR